MGSSSSSIRKVEKELLGLIPKLKLCTCKPSVNTFLNKTTHKTSPIICYSNHIHIKMHILVWFYLKQLLTVSYKFPTIFLVQCSYMGHCTAHYCHHCLFKDFLLHPHATCWSLCRITNKQICLIFFSENRFLYLLFSCHVTSILTLMTFVTTGLPCKSSTKHARCHVGSTTSRGVLLSRGWPSMRAASPQSKAASMSGTL